MTEQQLSSHPEFERHAMQFHQFVANLVSHIFSNKKVMFQKIDKLSSKILFYFLDRCRRNKNNIFLCKKCLITEKDAKAMLLLFNALLLAIQRMIDGKVCIKIKVQFSSASSHIDGQVQQLLGQQQKKISASSNHIYSC